MNRPSTRPVLPARAPFINFFSRGFSILLKRKGAFLGVALSVFLLSIPLPEGLSPEGLKTLALVALAFFFFATEPIPLPAVSILIAVLEVLLGLGNPDEVARSFFNDSVFFIMGSLMIATALTLQNFDKRIAWWIVQWTGPQVNRLVFGIIAASALIASIIGEHTAAAIMLPVVVSLLRFSGEDRDEIKNLSALMILSVAYGAMIAGIGTPSGGARNAIILAYWKELFNVKVGYGWWLVYVYPMILVQVPAVAFLLRRTFVPERADLSGAVLQLREKVEAEGPMKASAWTALGILGITIAMWITLGDRLGLGVIALIGVLLFLMTGVVRWEELNDKVNWGVILIYSGTLSLGFVMKRTGAAEWVAQLFLDHLEPLGMGRGIPFLVAVSLLTAGVTSILTTGGTVGILAPIILHMADLSGTSIIAAGLAMAVSSSFSFMTSFSSPVGNIVVGSGFLTSGHFMKGGWKMWVWSIFLLIATASTYWRLLGLTGR
ncbi:MAG TPA: DASS family sodium-coupled anion symporter [Candidatus Manganitrophaceae bacterium]|nr:DASS family sodium-coupled anion symporter [Candidatus Manganitrophaceae bacterium]